MSGAGRCGTTGSRGFPRGLPVGCRGGRHAHSEPFEVIFPSPAFDDFVVLFSHVQTSEQTTISARLPNVWAEESTQCVQTASESREKDSGNPKGLGRGPGMLREGPWNAGFQEKVGVNVISCGKGLAPERGIRLIVVQQHCRSTAAGSMESRGSPDTLGSR